MDVQPWCGICQMPVGSRTTWRPPQPDKDRLIVSVRDGVITGAQARVLDPPGGSRLLTRCEDAHFEALSVQAMKLLLGVTAPEEGQNCQMSCDLRAAPPPDAAGRLRHTLARFRPHYSLRSSEASPLACLAQSSNTGPGTAGRSGAETISNCGSSGSMPPSFSREILA